MTTVTDHTTDYDVVLTPEELKIINQRVSKAFAEVKRLSAGGTWLSCIPARHDDSDVLIVDGLGSFSVLWGSYDTLVNQVRAYQTIMKAMADGDMQSLRRMVECATEADDQ